jgi:hypothetical protein
MQRLLSLFFLVALVSCGPAHKTDSVSDSSAVLPEGELESVAENVNVLSADERRDGWELLFDGKNMNHWRPYQNKPNNSWEVVDGTLHCKAFNDQGPNQRADLVSLKQYQNFEFRFEWKVAPQTNSGVMFHVTEDLDEPYKTGPEYQILDDAGYPGEPEKSQLTGATYHMYAPDAGRDLNPVGEWNEGRILVNGNHVEHWLNGLKVVEYEIQSDDWNKRIQSSKWKDFPEYGKRSKGHLDLQDHSNEVWFRNLKVKVL